MSEISTLLREQSETLSELLEKQAQDLALFEQTQISAAEALVEQGVPAEEAAHMVKSAEEIQDLIPEPVNVDALFVSTVFEKAAQYIESLESTVAELQAKITNSEGLNKAAAISGPEAESLQMSGFSQDQVKVLAENGILEKVAHLTGSPWEPGSSSGRPNIGTLDPIERFCLGQ